MQRKRKRNSVTTKNNFPMGTAACIEVTDWIPEPDATAWVARARALDGHQTCCLVETASALRRSPALLVVGVV